MRQKKEDYLNIDKCSSCILNGSSIKVPDYGKTSSGVVFVGEAPAHEELIAKKPFVGESGRLLNKVLSVVGINRDETVIANSIKCKLPKLSKKNIRVVLDNCRGFLQNTLIKSKPKLIILLGDIALKQVLRKNTTISKVRGKILWNEEFNCYILPTYHPAYVLRWSRKEYPYISPDTMNGVEFAFLNDLKLAKEFMDSNFTPKKHFIETANYNLFHTKDLPLFSKGVFAFDVEWNTNGEVIGISFSNEPNNALVYIPYTSKNCRKHILKLLTNEKTIKVVANRPIDELMLYKTHGIKVNGVIHDVFLMAHLVDENIHISLESLADIYCGMKGIKDLSEGNREDLQKLSQPKFVQYAGADADATYKLYLELKKRLMNEPIVLKYYVNFLQPISNMLFDLKQTGCKIDVQKLKENHRFFEEEINKLHDEIIQMMPKNLREKYSDNLSLTRNNILIDWLFLDRKGLKLKPKQFTKNENLPSVTKDHLSLFSGHEVIDKIIQYKKLIKLQSTYIVSMYDYIHNDGRIYPDTFLYRTVTGRTAMTSPPIHQIPQRGSEYVSKIKELFVADDGFKMIAMDLSQSELRIMAWQANEKRLLDAFENGEDPHRLTASYITGKPVDKVTKEERQSAKGVNFGFIYGMSAESFVDYARTEYGVTITLNEAIEFRRKYFELFPSIAGYHVAVETFLREHGFIYSPLGRKRRLPAIFSPNREEQSSAKRKAINMRIQSFSSDLCLLGMYLFNEHIKKHKLTDKCKLLWSIHDAIFIQAKEDFVEEAIKLLYHCLTYRTKEYIYKNFNLVVNYRIEAEAKVGNSWADLKQINI